MTNHIRIPLRLQAPALCRRLRAEDSIADYIRDLIRLDIDEPDLLRYEHDSNKPLDDSIQPINTTLRLYYDDDMDIIEHLSGIDHPCRYIRELIYWDMGMDPGKIRSPKRKK